MATSQHDPRRIERLIKLMRSNNVRSLKAGDIEITLGPPPATPVASVVEAVREKSRGVARNATTIDSKIESWYGKPPPRGSIRIATR